MLALDRLRTVDVGFVHRYGPGIPGVNQDDLLAMGNQDLLHGLPMRAIRLHRHGGDPKHDQPAAIRAWSAVKA